MKKRKASRKNIVCKVELMAIVEHLPGALVELPCRIGDLVWLVKGSIK